MKLVVIHGDDILATRGRYDEIVSTIRKRGWNVLPYAGEPGNLGERMLGTGLFSDQSLVVVDNIGSISPKDLIWLSENKNTASRLLIWHKGHIPAYLLKKLPKETKIEKFDLPRLIFVFLDSLYPGNSKKAIAYLQKLAQEQPIQLIFAMITGHFRSLYWAAVDKSTLPYPGWRSSKLVGQAAKFNKKDLQIIISDLAAIDLKSKTSDSPLLPLLDQVLITHLE